MTQPTPDPVEWDEEVTLAVTVRVKAKSNPEFFEGLAVPARAGGMIDRTPMMAAMVAVFTGRTDLERIDGFADFVGEADVIDVQEGY